MGGFNYSVHFLRFIAISGVFIYHLFPSALIGAFAGVDIFFVVSGFVITLTIMKDYETNAFSFVKFYTRRIRRIFPALIFTIVLVLIALLLMYPTSHVINFSKTAKHAATQISNLYFINVRSDYFAIKLDNVMDPLLHTWSLGVEEQFYLVYPLIIFLIRKKTQKQSTLNYNLGALMVLSFAFSLFCVFHANNDMLFYSPLTRFWQLGLGCLIALNIKTIKSRSQKLAKFANVISLLGLLVIVLSFVLVSKINFPAAKALPVSIGAGLVIFASVLSSTLLCKIGKMQPFNFVAKISYSLYLSHWVVITIYKYFYDVSIFTFSDVVIIAALSIAIAWLMNIFIEKPFLQHKSLQQKKQAIILFFTMLALIFIANTFRKPYKYYPWRLKIAQNNIDPNIAKWLLQSRDTLALKDLCKHIVNSYHNRCLYGNTLAQPKYLIFGNSHVFNIIQTIDKISTKENVSFAVISPHGSIWHDTKKNKQYQIARDSLDLFLQEHKSIEYVIVSTRFGAHTVSQSDYMAIVERFIAVFLKNNKKVFLIGQIPNFNNNDIFALLERYSENLVIKNINNIVAPSTQSFSNARNVATSESSAGNNVLKAIANKYDGVEYFETEDYFCTQNTCSQIQNNNFLYRDRDHLDKEGNNHLATFLIPVLEKAMQKYEK